MTRLLVLVLLPSLALLFTQRGVSPNQPGTVSGTLKDAAGKPAVGVRVGAIAQSDSVADLGGVSVMASITQTDAAGRFRLESIPPGRYYIAAGRVDFPTYYPGTQAIGRGTVVAITPGAVVNGIDFAMEDSSARVAAADFQPSAAITFSLNVQATVAGGGKLPVFSPNGFTMIRMAGSPTGATVDFPINTSSIVVSRATGDYRLSIENVPPGYRVQSIMAGTTDVTQGDLKLSTLNFRMPPGNAGQASTTSGTPGATNATATLTITLAGAPTPPATTSGVRVAGKANKPGRRSIYLSGTPGFFYADGTFAFLGVPAGRHAIATLDNPNSKALVASVVVGSRDIAGIELEETAMLPPLIRSSTPGPAGPHPAGTTVKLASLRVSVVDESTQESAGPGSVFILGPFGTSFDLPADGRFEMLHLLPGEYRFEVQAFRRQPIVKTLVIGDDDVTLELPVQ